MKLDLRQPNLTGSDHEVLMGLKSYLLQLRDQLQWAFDNLDGVGSEGATSGAVSNTTIINSTSVPSNEKDAKATFDAIKSFIIGSADIANAYYDEVSTRLDGAYAAKGEYGEFVQQTTQTIKETSDRIDRNFENIQAIIIETEEIGDTVGGLNTTIETSVADAKSDLEGQLSALEAEQKREQNATKNSLDELGRNLNAFTSIIGAEGDEGQGTKVISIGVKGLIRSGLIAEENGVPIYGVAVGQAVNNAAGEEIFKANAQFRPDKLLFFNGNGDVESYIGQQKMKINYGEIDNRFKRGDLVDTVITEGSRDGDVVTRWEE